MSETGDTITTDDTVKTNAEPVNDTVKTDGKTFTQDEVSKMMTKEKIQGRNAVLNELGIDPKNTATMDEIKKFIESKKPESQKLAEQQIEQSNKLKELEQRAFIAEMKAEIMQAGVQLSFIDDAVALIMAKKTDDTFDVSAEIDTIKTKYPVWFAGETSTDGTPGKEGLKGTGSPIKAGSGGGQKTDDDLGKRLAEQRKSAAVASNPWDNKGKEQGNA